MKAIDKLKKLASTSQLSLNHTNNIINDATKRKINENKRKVELYTQKYNQYQKDFSQENIVIYKTFMDIANNNVDDLKSFFSNRRIVRKLASCLTYSENGNDTILDSIYFKYALEIFDNNFSRSVAMVLFLTILEKWNHPTIQSLIEIVRRKKNSLHSRKSHFSNVLVENYAFFFSNRAISNLYKVTNQKGIHILDLCKFLNIHNSCIFFEYFSVFIEYYTVLKIKDNISLSQIDNILKFLARHDNKETNKRCVVKIIIHASKINISDEYQQKLINFCFKYIGDPSIDIYWQPWEFSTKYDRDQLELARTIINQWLAHKFIYLFFEKLSNFDADRRDFWVRYAKHILNFKIYMEPYQRDNFIRLNRDLDINLLDSKIGILNKANSTSAFIMRYSTHTIVEFSKSGDSASIFLNTNSDCPTMGSISYDKKEIKLPGYYPKNIYHSNHYITDDNSEGRLLHTPPHLWAKVMDYWMKKYLNIEV